MSDVVMTVGHFLVFVLGAVAGYLVADLWGRKMR